MILEEFGLARDGGTYKVDSSTEFRDRFFRKMLAEVRKGPLVGANIWAWAGEGRPKSPGAIWQQGDPLIGDPPHEHQGWYSVYDGDEETLEVLRAFSMRLKK